MMHAQGIAWRTWLLIVAGALAWAMLAAPAWGGVEMRQVEAKATGATRDEAIFNALGEAVRQVHGAKVDATREIRRSMQRTSVRDGQGHSTTVEQSSRYDSGTRVESQGLISGYEVLGVSPAMGGGQMAHLRVKVPVYRAPGSTAQSNRQRLAVYPVEVDARRLQVAGERLAPGDASRRLTQSLVRAFVGSRRFAVLDRDMRDAINAEQRFVASGQVPLAQKAMLGRNLGADYLVTSRLTGMDMALETVTNPVSGERSQKATGAATLEARVVVPATGQVMWSETLNVSLDDLGVAPSSGDFTQQVFDALGRELTFRALNVIYPLRVVESTGDEIVLNQGGAIVKAGQRFGVYDIGKRYTDPYHGESLGPRENWTADVEITRVMDKVAYARIIKGQVEGDGQVLRRTASAQEAREAKRAAQRGTRERVCLPMDPC